MSDRVISETVSQKQGRGRPTLMTRDEVALYGAIGLFDDNTTRRGRNNVFYRQRALLVIGGGREPEFSWLADRVAMERGEKKSWRPTILGELGRIEDDELLRAFARELCRAKPRAREAVVMVRRHRIGGCRPGNPIALAGEIRSTVNAYLQRHPDVAWADVLEALAEVEVMVKATIDLET